MLFFCRSLLLVCCGWLIGCAQHNSQAKWSEAIKQHRWELVNWTGHSIPNGDNGQPIIINFTADPTSANKGRISGFSGCNRFSASYQIDQQQLTFGPFMSTKMACASHKMQFETQFLNALAQIDHYQLQLPYLTLSNSQMPANLLRFYQRPTE